jgi:tRNA-2-methylthio-N6-dimethylallyladenosine synthase
LLAVQQDVCTQENRKLVGQRVEVLVEGQSKLVSRRGNVEVGWEKPTMDGQLVGRTRGDQVVVFDGPSSLTGRILDLNIIDARGLTLFGQRI